MTGRTDMGPYSIVPRWVREACKGKPVALVLYVVLADHADRNTDNGWTMGRQALAEELGVTDRTVDAAVKHLETIGALEVTRNKVGDRHAWSRYLIRTSTGVAKQISPGVAKQISGGGEADFALPIRTPISKPKTRVGDEFDVFWKLFPPTRRQGKPSALRAWSKIKPEEYDAVLAGLTAWVEKWKRDGTEPRFIKTPAPWLNDRRWEDVTAAGPPVSSEAIQMLDGKKRNVYDGSWWSDEEHRWMNSPSWLREHPEYAHLRKARQ